MGRIFLLELGWVGFFWILWDLLYYIFFLGENEEVVSSVHLIKYLLKFSEVGPSVFFDFFGFELGLVGFFWIL
jgi:hypothetical protein